MKRRRGGCYLLIKKLPLFSFSLRLRTHRSSRSGPRRPGRNPAQHHADARARRALQSGRGGRPAVFRAKALVHGRGAPGRRPQRRAKNAAARRRRSEGIARRGGPPGLCFLLLLLLLLRCLLRRERRRGRERPLRVRRRREWPRDLKVDAGHARAAEYRLWQLRIAPPLDDERVVEDDGREPRQEGGEGPPGEERVGVDVEVDLEVT